VVPASSASQRPRLHRRRASRRRGPASWPCEGHSRGERGAIAADFCVGGKALRQRGGHSGHRQRVAAAGCISSGGVMCMQVALPGSFSAWKDRLGLKRKEQVAPSNATQWMSTTPPRVDFQPTPSPGSAGPHPGDVRANQQPRLSLQSQRVAPEGRARSGREDSLSAPEFSRRRTPLSERQALRVTALNPRPVCSNWHVTTDLYFPPGRGSLMS